MNVPNKITLARICLIPFFIIILSVPLPWKTLQLYTLNIPLSHIIAAIIFIIAAGTDWLDGYYARKYNLITSLGKFLDPLADKLLVTAAFILLVDLKLAPAWVVIIILSREFAVTGLRLVASGEGIVLAAGNLGKIKTATQMIAIVLLLLHNWPFVYLEIPFDMILLYISLFFTIVSGYEYFVKNWHVMRDQQL